MNQFFKNGQTVLFQGDSITDCGRDYEDLTSLGGGYPSKIAEIYKTLFPGANVNFINKGVSGARIPDLIVRYVEDIMDIAPDFISIFIGINDVWRRYDSNDPSTIDAFRDHYEYLLKMIRSHMPETKIMLIEPFVLNSLPDRASWREDLDPKIQVVREMASLYADFYIPLDGIMAANCTGRYTPQELSEDGVHPSALGHAIIAEAYFRTLGVL
ncbi:MAG: SGNH/GDSL hydrolase family protein [Saccharofermentanales bacterium]